MVQGRVHGIAPINFDHFPKSQVKNVSIKRNCIKRSTKAPLLWKFFKDLLDIKTTATDPKIVEWLDRDKGIFKINDAQAVSDLWGKKKNRKGMTYEHLSRGLRYYYKQGIMAKMPGPFVYRFCCNSLLSKNHS